MEGFDYAAVEYAQNGAPRGANKNIIRFKTLLIENNAESIKSGYPQQVEHLYLEVVAPGEKGGHEVPAGKKTSPMDLDVERFCKKDYWLDIKAAYENFKNIRGGKPGIKGYAIDEWPPISRSMVAELRAHNIYTVEDVSNVSDSNLGVLGLYGRRLRDQAKDFIAKAKGDAPVIQLRAEVERLQEQCKYYEEQIKILKDSSAQPASHAQDISTLVNDAVANAMKALIAPEKKARGRPKKNLDAVIIPDFSKE